MYIVSTHTNMKESLHLIYERSLRDLDYEWRLSFPMPKHVSTAKKALLQKLLTFFFVFAWHLRMSWRYVLALLLISSDDVVNSNNDMFFNIFVGDHKARGTNCGSSRGVRIFPHQRPGANKQRLVPAFQTEGW